MWCRFLTFCVLVSFILFVVASCIYGRPSFHLFFHRCCGEDIENDQVIFENFGNNFLKERLVGGDIIEADSETVFENEDVGRIADETKEVSVNNPEVKKWIADAHVSDSDNPDTDTEDLKEDELHDVNKNKEKENELNVTNYESSLTDVEDVVASTLSDVSIEEQTRKEIYLALSDQENKEKNKVVSRSYDLLDNEAEEITDTANNEFLNVHDIKHKQMARTI